MDNILAVVAHPDDEVLGCGGTLARHIERGDDVRILFLTNGTSARGHDPAKIQRRRTAAQAAAQALGAMELVWRDFPDNMLDTRPLLELVRTVEAVIRETCPDVIYTHHAGDLNVDHRLTHQAVITSCRPLPTSKIRLIAAFEVLSSTEWQSPSAETAFVPRLYVDITRTMERKLSALRCYDEELRSFPHPRSEQAVKALAVYRGATIGFELAEAFDVIRWRIGEYGGEQVL
jgi:LmbE family N-acetylglucosaminyl deacetylase